VISSYFFAKHRLPRQWKYSIIRTYPDQTPERKGDKFIFSIIPIDTDPLEAQYSASFPAESKQVRDYHMMEG